jgi:hypothetical protein
MKVRAAFSISIDGFGAGPRQSEQDPLGLGGMQLHDWMFATRTFKAMQGGEGGSTDTDDAIARRGGAAPRRDEPAGARLPRPRERGDAARRHVFMKRG